MNQTTAAVIITMSLSVVGVLGDAFLKLATRELRPFTSWAFFAGFLLYASTAFGWVIALRHLKLAAVGSIYCVVTVLLLTVIGRCSFAESLSGPELLGVALGLVSFFLLFRFA